MFLKISNEKAIREREVAAADSVKLIMFSYRVDDGGRQFSRGEKVSSKFSVGGAKSVGFLFVIVAIPVFIRVVHCKEKFADVVKQPGSEGGAENFPVVRDGSHECLSIPCHHAAVTKVISDRKPFADRVFAKREDIDHHDDG